ncbi:MAG: glycosyltransferase family 4 protein [Salinimicrobium sp.]
MKTLFVIGYVWPEPSSSAAGARMMQLLEFFQRQGYNVIFGTTASTTPHAVDLQSFGIEPLKIELNNSSFDVLLKQMQPEFVLFDRFMMEEQFGWRVAEACPDAIRILDTEDLHFLRKARQEAFKKDKNEEALNLQTELAKREIASIYRCDLSLIISESEMQLLKYEFSIPETLLCYLPFMLKMPSAEKLAENPLFETRENFISIGNFLHEPNWDAVRNLKENIWPKIRKELPKAQLHVYGAYVGKKVEQLHNEKEGFLIQGRAASALEVMRNARVLLAPLRFGAGLKGKFIDAMKAGTPAVTTSLGAEGMAAPEEWNGLIADDASVFAEAAVKLYADKQLWQEARKKGFLSLQKFSEERHSKSFRSTLIELGQNLEGHRKANFTGQMLLHHSLASTKQLSKYIEMKNRLQQEMAKKKDHPQNG